MLLLIDNYDSFVHNLARYFQRLGQETLVVRNDAIDVARVRQLQPSALVLSPGPCTPARAGCCLSLVEQLQNELPILGVCLGHQAICEALGGQVVRANQPMHGRTSQVLHDGRGIFAETPNPLTACRYHSLVVEERSLPDCLEVSARTDAGVVMAVRHRDRPIVGVQFHPESILTDEGYSLMANFLQLANLPVTGEQPTMDDERPATEVSENTLPNVPVTF